MCCLPNQFPLPIFLILNLKQNSENYQNNNNSTNNFRINYTNIKEKSKKNMFFKLFVINLKENLFSENENIDNENRDNIINFIEKSDSPFYEMIELLMKFNDLKENILQEYSKGNSKRNKNNSINSSRNNNNNEDDDVKNKKNCLIL